MMNVTETEMKETLGQFNKGVYSVQMQYGIIQVGVTSAKSAKGVAHDLLLSGACKSINYCFDGKRNGGILVNGVQ